MKVLIIKLTLMLIGTSALFAADDSPSLGVAIDPEIVADWDRSVFPDGAGLPSGSGNVSAGEILYQKHCLACHGPYGLGDTADQLAGATMSLTSAYPEKTIGTYWPYATTLFDMIRRSMPMNAPGTLTDDEVYSLTAYLLYLNAILNKNAELNEVNLPQIKMPNMDGFIDLYQD